MAKCYACKNYQSGYCKLTGTHSYTGDICNEFANKEQSKMFEDSKSELRATKHALWMARALRALTEAAYWVRCGNNFEQSGTYHILAKKWNWVYRKCLQKAKEFECLKMEERLNCP